MKKHLRKNDKGSALVWVLVLCIIFAIIGISLGWVALSMHKRSIQNNQNSQAYLSARSGCDLIFDYLNGDPTKSELSNSLYNNVIQGSSHSCTYTDIFKNVVYNGKTINNMGKCDVTVTYKDGTVTVKSTATLTLDASTNNQASEQTETVQMTATRKHADKIWPAKVWAINSQSETNALSGTSQTFTIGKFDDRPLNKAVDFTVYRVKNQGTTSGSLAVYSNSVSNAALASPSYRYLNQAIFIYIDDSSAGLTSASTEKVKELSITGITGYDTDYGPDIFIYVGANSKLVLKGNATYPFYIVLGTGASVDTRSTGTANVNYVGTNTTGTATNIKPAINKTPSNLQVSNYAYNCTQLCSNDDSSDTAKGANAIEWEKGEYSIIN